MKLNIQCVKLNPNRNFAVVSLAWYSGKASPNRPVLCICYANGNIQIMTNENDDC